MGTAEREDEEGYRKRIGDELIRRGQEFFNAPVAFVEFTKYPPADRLLNDLSEYPHAFVLACVMDRQYKAEKAWMIPYELSQRLGGFSFPLLSSVSEERFREVFGFPRPLHRLWPIMSRNAYRAIQRIGDVYDGDAALIWSGSPPSAQVVSRFLAFDGIGPKIATMAANILARELKVQLADHYSIDVSADVHVRRVFQRLQLVVDRATIEQVVYQARSLHPTFPGLMDFPAFQIGREWCRPENPKCGECYMHSLCRGAIRSDVG